VRRLEIVTEGQPLQSKSVQTSESFL